jgi:hypothetical protein
LITNLFIEGENVNEFIRKKNSGRDISHGGFDTLAIRHFGREDAVTSHDRFSKREEPLRFQMRGLSRE